MAESKSGRDTPKEGTSTLSDEAKAAADAAARAAEASQVDYGAEAVSWFRLAAEAHGSRDAALLMADCAYGSVPTATAPQATQEASVVGNSGGGSVAAGMKNGGGAGSGGGSIHGGSSVGSGPKKGTTAGTGAAAPTVAPAAAAVPASRDDDSAVRWLKAALKSAEGQGNEDEQKKSKKKRSKFKGSKSKNKNNLLLVSEDASTVGQESSMFDDSHDGMSGHSLESSSQQSGPALSLSALGYGGEGEGFTGGLIALEALTNLGECYYHGEVKCSVILL